MKRQQQSQKQNEWQTNRSCSALILNFKTLDERCIDFTKHTQRQNYHSIS